MKLFRAGLGCAYLLTAVLTSAAQKLPWQTSDSSNANSNQQVRYLYPQQVTLQAGKSQIVDLHFRIENGLHINSHAPLQKSLIRTQLMVAEPQGVNISAVDFPPGSDYAFPADPSQKLSVYSGEFVLKMHITPQSGDHLVQASLRYQACDMHTCFPPRNAPVVVDVIAK